MRTASDPTLLVHEAACDRARLQARHGLRQSNSVTGGCRSWRFSILSAVLVVGVASCSTGSNDSTGRDSVQAALRHDARVIDSLARLVNTDSLYRLSRSMVRASNPVPLYQETICEQARIMRRHGVRPALLALKRMEDTLWTKGEKKLYEAMEQRMPVAHNFEIHESVCGPFGQAAPSRVDGVPLAYRPNFRR